MKKQIVSLLALGALLLVSSVASRADQFSDIQNSPYTYWVPAPRPGTAYSLYYYPPPGYVAGPPPPYYYGPPAVYFSGPRFFFGFHFH